MIRLFLMRLLLVYIASVRIISAHSHRIYVNSIPKCGTHLLAGCLELLTDRIPTNLLGDKITKNGISEIPENAFYYFHVPYSEKAAEVFEKNQFRCFLIYRDPRDQVVSQAFWLLELQKRKAKDFDAVLTDLIGKVDHVYRPFLPWLDHPQYMAVKFENLVGPQGGGHYMTQIREMVNIARHAGIPVSLKKIAERAKKMFGKSIKAKSVRHSKIVKYGTFRSGQIGDWKKYFKPYHRQLFAEKAGQLLIDLKYESNNNWVTKKKLL